MAESTLVPGFWDDADTMRDHAENPRRHPPLLMGDIVAHRCGVPELLIQWRRAQGEEDPIPR
ncbi:hypothetical protein [Ovoidimarina sediminis]|uniref:hypothetical protein n=1 Tax=Ovoidimarina sediminis TaxID=3079856 RepID=UPI00290FDAC0|nr:hypothetical protein [Rhodophyticola sp. MJ-SS7]MDU8945303.1 hypothetical protein [Rhodophyticola sp. MJ-SS7]